MIFQKISLHNIMNTSDVCQNKRYQVNTLETEVTEIILRASYLASLKQLFNE